ncbi:MAG: TolC family protein [Bacteroidales bacterium]
MEIGELENQLAMLKDQKEILTVGFNNMLDRASDQQVTLPVTLESIDFPISKEAAIDSVSLFNHTLLSIDFARESMEFKKELSRLQGNPSFTVGMDYTVIEKGDNNMAGRDAFMLPVIGMSLPLNRNKYRSIVREAAYLSEAKSDEMAEKKNNIETVFEKGWKEYIDAGRRVTLYMTQLDLAGRSSALLESAYSSGRVDFPELLNMEKKRLMYSLELEKARSDRYTAVAFINYLMGQ